MPDSGRLSEDRLPHTGPAISPYYPAPPWKLSGARILKVVYETDAAPVLDWLPPKLTRSSPPYAVVTIESYAESPVGPFNAATQFIGCRAGFFIRALALQTVIDSTVAFSALREVWGYPARPGHVSLRETKTGARARVECEGETQCEIGLKSTGEIPPGLIRLDPVLTLRTAPSLQEGRRHDLLQMVQVDPDYEVTAAKRGTGTLTPNGSWAVLPVRNVIASAIFEANTELPLARFVMPY